MKKRVPTYNGTVTAVVRMVYTVCELSTPSLLPSAVLKALKAGRVADIVDTEELEILDVDEVYLVLSEDE